MPVLPVGLPEGRMSFSAQLCFDDDIHTSNCLELCCAVYFRRLCLCMGHGRCAAMVSAFD